MIVPLSRRRALGLALASLLVGCDGDEPPPPSAAPPRGEPEEGVLRLMGTGAMTPLAQALAKAWGETPEGKRWRVVIEPSVGSGGGVRAANDGAVDLGMISRPLNERERGLGLEERKVARGGVVLAVIRSFPLEKLSRAEVEQLYGGEPLQAQGERVSLLLRDREESANTALERLIPSLGPLRDQAYLHRKARVLFHDEAMREALVSTPGAVGVTDLGSVLGQGALKAIQIDDVAPSIDALRSGSWKASRDLAFVFRPERRARVEALLRFASSPAASAAYEQIGCVLVAP